MLFPPNTNSKPVCIKAETATRQHKWFPPGAAFKLLGGKISGINPDFADTWEMVPDHELKEKPTLDTD